MSGPEPLGAIAEGRVGLEAPGGATFSRALARCDAERAGRHFAAVTDPGASLEPTARRLGLRGVFLNDPAIAGRFSAPTFFGPVPATICGIDRDQVLRVQLGESGPAAGEFLGGIPRAPRS
jgi:hypothetical protein